MANGWTSMPPSSPDDRRDAVRDARWKLAFEANGDGVWDWEVQSGRVDFSAGLKTMLGYPADAPWSTVDDWSSRVHPDDLPRTMAVVQEHLDGLTTSYSSEHRLRCEDGRWKWILARGMVLTRDAAGKPLRMLGSHTDISASREAKENLEGQRRLLETVLEHAPIGFALFSIETNAALYVNTRFGEICGVPSSTLTNRTSLFDQIFQVASERDAIRARVMTDVGTGYQGRLRWDDIPLTQRSGEKHWVSAVSLRIPDQQLVILAIQDVTEAHLSAEAMRAQTDQLRERNEELVRFNEAAVDRELRMIELKREVNALLDRLGEPTKYGVDG